MKTIAFVLLGILCMVLIYHSQTKKYAKTRNIRELVDDLRFYGRIAAFFISLCIFCILFSVASFLDAVNEYIGRIKIEERNEIAGKIMSSAVTFFIAAVVLLCCSLFMAMTVCIILGVVFLAVSIKIAPKPNTERGR